MKALEENMITFFYIPRVGITFLSKMNVPKIKDR